MQLVLRAGFSSHEAVRERRLLAFPAAGLVQGRELILNDEPSPGIHFVSPAPRRDRRGVGRARRYSVAIGHNPIGGFGIFRADRKQIVSDCCRRCRRCRGWTGYDGRCRLRRAACLASVDSCRCPACRSRIVFGGRCRRYDGYGSNGRWFRKIDRSHAGNSFLRRLRRWRIRTRWHNRSRWCWLRRGSDRRRNDRRRRAVPGAS